MGPHDEFCPVNLGDDNYDGRLLGRTLSLQTGLYNHRTIFRTGRRQCLIRSALERAILRPRKRTNGPCPVGKCAC